MPNTQQVFSDHIVQVPVGPSGTTITVIDGGTVYYGDTIQTSSTLNQGSLTVGQQATITDSPLWVRSANASTISVSVLAATPTTGVSSSTPGLVGTLNAPLVSGTTYNSTTTPIPATLTQPINQLASGVPANQIPFRIAANDGSGYSQLFLATGQVAAGATSIPVVSGNSSATSVAYQNFPTGSLVYAQPALTAPAINLDGRYRGVRSGRIAFAGASFANGTGANSGNSAQNGTFGSGFVTKVCQLSGGLLRPVANVSINAGTDGAAELLAKFGRIVAANPDIVCLDAGWLDHEVSGWGRTPANAVASMATFVALCHANGIEVILTSLPPRGPGISTSEQVWLQSNLVAQDFAVKNGVMFVDCMSALTTGSGSNWLSQYLFGDNQHPNEAGHLKIAQLIWNAIQGSAVLPRSPFWLPNSDGDPWNLLAKGCFATGSGSAVPPSWVAGGSSAVATFAYSTVTDVPGQVLTISRSTNDGTKSIQQNVTTGFSVGDTLAFVGEWQSLTLQASVSSFLAQATFSGATGPLPPSISPAGNSGADFTTPGRFYMQAVVPPSTTGILVKCTLNNGTAAVAASVALDRLGLYNLTQLGISY